MATSGAIRSKPSQVSFKQQENVAASSDALPQTFDGHSFRPSISKKGYDTMVENYDIPTRQGRSSTFDSLVAPAVMLRQPATIFAKQKKRLERPSSAVLFKQ